MVGETKMLPEASKKWTLSGQKFCFRKLKDYLNNDY
jgi:hypothetical protein